MRSACHEAEACGSFPEPANARHSESISTNIRLQTGGPAGYSELCIVRVPIIGSPTTLALEHRSAFGWMPIRTKIMSSTTNYLIQIRPLVL